MIRFCSERYGICDITRVLSGILGYYAANDRRRQIHGKSSVYLYFIPLAVIASVNLWNGVIMNYSSGETMQYIISMLTESTFPRRILS